MVRTARQDDTTKQAKRVRGFEPVPYPHLQMNTRPEYVMLPERGSSKAAGYDFAAPCGLRIAPGQKVFFWTDVCAYMQDGEVLLLDVRSSTGTKKDLMLSNTIGVIDTDYYHNPKNGGNIGISLRNLTHEAIIIEKGEKVVQGIFVPFLPADDGDTDKLRNGGFGSSNE
jgi:dUTP pyrophosphatase